MILDLFSRKVIAYELSPSLNTKLAIETLDMAVASRNVSNGVICVSANPPTIRQRRRTVVK